MIDLGALDGFPITSARDINAQGAVTGWMFSNDPAAPRNHGFVWTKENGMQDLGVVPGLSPDTSSSTATAINDASEIVGYGGPPSDTSRHPFYRSAAGVMQSLGNLPGGTQAQAVDINNNGQVVGSSFISGTTHTWLWTESTGLQDLGGRDLGPDGNWDLPRPSAISQNGDIVGRISTPSGGRAFLRTSDGEFQQLGILGAPYALLSTATGVNSSFEIVGSSSGNGISQAFYWTSDGGMQGIGFLPGDDTSTALDINAGGEVVGQSGAGNDRRAFYWTTDGGMQDLNDLLDSSGDGWTLETAGAINDAGWIVGSGDHDGATHAYLLIPVPEPSTPVLAALGIAGLAVWKRRRQFRATRLSPQRSSSKVSPKAR